MERILASLAQIGVRTQKVSEGSLENTGRQGEFNKKTYWLGGEKELCLLVSSP